MDPDKLKQLDNKMTFKLGLLTYSLLGQVLSDCHSSGEANLKWTN